MLVERWFAKLSNRKLPGSALGSITELERDVRRWTTCGTPTELFVWIKIADQILDTLAALHTN